MSVSTLSSQSRSGSDAFVRAEPGPPAEWIEWLRFCQETGYKPPQGRDRCPRCGFDLPTMGGHRFGCPLGEAAA